MWEMVRLALKARCCCVVRRGDIENNCCAAFVSDGSKVQLRKATRSRDWQHSRAWAGACSENSTCPALCARVAMGWYKKEVKGANRSILELAANDQSDSHLRVQARTGLVDKC